MLNEDGFEKIAENAGVYADLDYYWERVKLNFRNCELIMDFLKNPSTVAASKNKTLAPEKKEQIAGLYYREGAYCNDFMQDPDSALFYLRIAEEIFTDTGNFEQLAWTNSRLALTYKQKLIMEKQEKELRSTYANVVKTGKEPPSSYAVAVEHYLEQAKCLCKDGDGKAGIMTFAASVRALTELPPQKGVSVSYGPGSSRLLKTPGAVAPNSETAPKKAQEASASMCRLS